MDLILRHATLPDGRKDVDLGVQDGRFVALTPRLVATAPLELDCTGRLVSPPFVDAHFHLDSALALRPERPNVSGTLLEGIEMWGELKPTLTFEAIKARAHAYIRMAIGKGLLAIRSHVDVCDPRLLAVEALLEVKREVARWVHLELVAFPQDGFLRDPRAETNLLRALDLGVDVVGGIPHFERTADEGRESIRRLCRIAADRGLRVDMHCDETDDPASRHVETLASETIRLGLSGRVTGSHLTSMHSMDNDYVGKLIPLLAEARLGVVANPLINITLQGRRDTYPKRRGMTRVPELLDAGLDVAFGHDCVRDPWYALGSGDMLEVAHMGLHVAQMTSVAGMRAAYEAITTHPARLLGLDADGIRVGAAADCVVLQADDPIDALRTRAPRLFVIRGGRVLARTAPLETTLDLSG